MIRTSPSPMPCEHKLISMCIATSDHCCVCTRPGLTWRYCAPCRSHFTPSRPALPPPLSHHTPPTLCLESAAEDASILLQAFAQTCPLTETELRQQLVDNAIIGLTRIQRQMRSGAGAGAGMEVESGCVVCYSRVADTLVLPCAHLALCEVCCDAMGIMAKSSPGRRTVRCPICRCLIVDRVKVFRA